MFCEVLLCSRKREFYKREGKSKVKEDAKKTEKRQRGRNVGKRLGGIFLRVFGHCMLLYLQQYFIYYKSGCGRRQIAEPPKIMCVVSF